MAKKNRRQQSTSNTTKEKKETNVSEPQKDEATTASTGTEDQGPVEKVETSGDTPSPSSSSSKASTDSNEDKVLSKPAGNTSAAEKPKPAKKETAKVTPTETVETNLFYIPLLNFVRAFKKGRPIQQEACRLQLALYGLYMDILKLDPADSRVAMNVLLGYMHKNKDIFDDVNMTLYPYGWTKGRTTYEQYTSLSLLYLRTCDPKTRKKALGEISLDKILNKGFSTHERDNLVRFYV